MSTDKVWMTTLQEKRTENPADTEAQTAAFLGVDSGRDDFQAIEAIPIRNPYEIGRAFDGCSDHKAVINRQRGVLEDMIKAYSNDAMDWELMPEIRTIHNHDASLSLLDFGRKFEVNRRPCQWAAYGILYSLQPPKDWYVQEGVRIPNEDHP